MHLQNWFIILKTPVLSDQYHTLPAQLNVNRLVPACNIVFQITFIRYLVYTDLFHANVCGIKDGHSGIAIVRALESHPWRLHTPEKGMPFTATLYKKYYNTASYCDSSYD